METAAWLSSNRRGFGSILGCAGFTCLSDDGASYVMNGKNLLKNMARPHFCQCKNQGHSQQNYAAYYVLLRH
jgi:hypothetical protein